MRALVHDLTGQKFNRLTAISYEKPHNGRGMWLCRCDCGNSKLIKSSNLLQGDIKSCGCLKANPNPLSIGQVFGHLTVLEYSGFSSSRGSTYKCICKCGVEKVVARAFLFTSGTKSCGCYLKEQNFNACFKGYKELSGSFWYSVSYNANRRALSFDISMKDAYELYLKQEKKCALSGVDLILKHGRGSTASIDRIDSEKGYCIDNIQWVHKTINVMKMAMKDIKFIELCTLVANHHKTTNP